MIRERLLRMSRWPSQWYEFSTVYWHGARSSRIAGTQQFVGNAVSGHTVVRAQGVSGLGHGSDMDPVLFAIGAFGL